MPLIKVDLIEGRNKQQILNILDSIHEAVVRSFKVPESDRYQVVNQHQEHEMIMEDTGLGLKRTKDMVLISIVSSPRTKDMKENFYKLVSNLLFESCSISKEDIVINFTENTIADWSFGNGEAQYITGELS